MTTAAQRVPIRRWFYATYIAMSSAELGVHHTAIRCAMGTGGFVGARLWVRATRLAPRREPVALILDDRPPPYAMWPFEKSHDTGYLRWVGARQRYVRRPQPMWPAVVLPPVTRPGEQAPPAADARAAGFGLDLTVEMSVGIGSVSLTVEVLARSARRRCGQRMRDLSEVFVLRWLYRHWLGPDSN